MCRACTLNQLGLLLLLLDCSCMWTLLTSLGLWQLMPDYQPASTPYMMPLSSCSGSNVLFWAKVATDCYSAWMPNLTLPYLTSLQVNLLGKGKRKALIAFFFINMCFNFTVTHCKQGIAQKWWTYTYTHTINLCISSIVKYTHLQNAMF